MEKRMKLLELRTLDGTVFFSMLVSEKEVSVEDETEESPGRNAGKGTSKVGPQGKEMTEPQRKFLYQILGHRNLEGEAAESYLKKLFGVESLDTVTKFQARKMIERLLEEDKGGKEGEQPDG